MKPVLIVKAGRPSPSIVRRFGSFEDWIADGAGLDSGEIRTVEPFRDNGLADPTTVSGVVVTGSSAMITDHEPWAEHAAAWLREAVERGVPILGICFGHQLLAHAFGGRVGDNPNGREIGTVRVHQFASVAEDPLVGGLSEELVVQATHRQSVLKLPPSAVLLAGNDHDPHHAFRIGDLAWGTQFHPEITAEIMRAYIDERRAVLAAEGLDPEALYRATQASPAGPALLRRFVAICRLSR